MSANDDPGEKELKALGAIVRWMAQLDGEERERVLVYLCDRYVSPERRSAFRAMLREGPFQQQ